MNAQPHTPADSATKRARVNAINSALQLARDHRLPVFPCGINKRPLTTRGFKDASTDEAQIRNWWARNPDALIGVPTGAVSGLLVIDIDPAGADFLLEYSDQLAAGRRHHTRRGLHYLFGIPSGVKIGCSASKLAEGVDVRSDGGYVIWWPANGEKVEGPEIDKLPSAPKWLVELLANMTRSVEGSTNEVLTAEPRHKLMLAEIAELLKPIDPSIGYHDWIRVLMAVHHETSGNAGGLELADEWSRGGHTRDFVRDGGRLETAAPESKYMGRADVTKHWDSFDTERSNIVSAAWLKKFSAEQAESRGHSLEGRRRFAVVPDHQFVERNPLVWHIKGVLPKAELAVVYGPSGSGKSFLAFDMISAIATGATWHGCKTTKGRAVFVLAEGSTGFRNRLMAYAMMHAGNFPGVRIVDSAPNLLGEQDHVLLAKEIEISGGADLIIIDTLAASSPGADENAAKDMGRVIEHCKRLHKSTGATVLLVHHSGKDESKGARGWSGLRAAVDAEIEVNRTGDYRTASVTKLKDGEDRAKFAFKLVPIEICIDADGDPVISCVLEYLAVAPPGTTKAPRPGTIERTLLDAIRGDLSIDGRISISSVIETVEGLLPQPEGRDTRKQHLSRALRALAAKGLIAIEGEKCRCQ